MSSRMRRSRCAVAAISMARGFLVGLPLVLAAGCATGSPSPGKIAQRDELAAPPRIAPPIPSQRTVLSLDPGALPKGARAHFPAYDGDPIFVTLPAQQMADLTAPQVLMEIIGPVLKSIGFRGGPADFATPSPEGVKQPRADFKRLAQTVADEYARNPKLQRRKTEDMLAVFLGTRAADGEIDRALSTGEGMTFAQYVAGIERLEIQYPFQQLHQGVAIERSMLIASRWEGQGVTSVFGSVFSSYVVENKPTLSAAASVEAARRALLKLPGIEAVPEQRLVGGPDLMLLPYGTDQSGLARLRYVQRMALRAVFAGHEGRFLVWLDAENGIILKLEPFLAQVSASGSVYNRDPGIGTTPGGFQVDPSSGGQYTLHRSGVSGRIEYKGDPAKGANVSISDSTGRSSPSAANFDQAPINDAAQALCAWGSNRGFQQINLLSTLSRQYETVFAQGIFTPFPDLPWMPQVETLSNTSWSYMNFGAGQGYFDPACPNYYSGVPADPRNHMNFAHDNSMIGHELGHNATWRLTELRPTDWCSTPPCALPVGWGVLHDLADFWGAHLESTPCIGGWVAKNMRGIGASLNCALSDENNKLPRKLEVTTPLNAGDPRDHFPEHRRRFGGGDYSNGQIGGAALWQVREGMRSKCRPSGLPQFGVRFQRALKQTGFFGFEPTFSDRGVYQLLYDLEAKMADQWATSGSPGGPPAFAHNGPHTTNKVTAGFARAGIFLIPYQCLGSATVPGDPTSCPAGGNGGDAVIDVDDNDTADDLALNGVTHPEGDFLKLGGPAPTFHVWTGPRYRLNGSAGAATFTNPAPCNARFQVEVSTDPAFPAGSTTTSAWVTVATNPGSITPQCYGTWTPSWTEWTALQAGGAGSRIYYRSRTQNAAGGNGRVSTLPGNGLWTVPPPYAVITATGQSDY
jgi:hypothetical protein